MKKKINSTPRFKRAYKKLTEEQKKQIKEALKLFGENSKHPSLRIKPIKQTNNKIYEASAGALRITFEWEKPDGVLLRNCGAHDPTIKNP
ncbi:TPA: cytotoxin [Bacillus cereus]